MKLSVIIVNYNVRYYIQQCLNSLERATTDIEKEIFVVDNNSEDYSVPYLRKHFGKKIELIESNHNLGYARANNIAIRESSGEYVLLLNPDTFVGENSIRQVIEFMDAHPKAGGVGVKMHNSDGTLARESRRGLPTPFVSLLKMCGFSKRYYMSHLSWDEPGQIEVISGAFCMLRRSALDRVGMLDKDFFMYGEDIDLSYRILKGGYENWYVPANILHYKGESTQKSSFRYVHVFYQAMIIFFRKHYGHMSFLLTFPIKIAIYLRAIVALFYMQYGRMWKSLGLGYDNFSATQFCFVGRGAMLNECKKLARRKGLEATFCKSLQEVKKCDVLVFEVDSKVTYEEILTYAREHSGEFEIGTFSQKSHVLITPTEIIQ